MRKILYVILWGARDLSVNRAIAREALRLGAMKLPIKTRVVVREDW